MTGRWFAVGRVLHGDVLPAVVAAVVLFVGSNQARVRGNSRARYQA